MLKRLLRGVGANALGQIIVIVLQVVSVPVILSQWGVELYGSWLLMFAIPSYIAMGDLGLGAAAASDMTMRVAVGDKGGALRTFQSAWVTIGFASVSISATIAALLWLTPAELLQSWFRMPAQDVRWTLLLLVAYAMACMQGSIIFAGYRCDGRFATGAMLNALQLLFEGVVALSLVIAGGGVTGVAAGYLAARCLGTLTQVYTLRRVVPWLCIGVSEFDWESAKRLFKPAAAIMTLPLSFATILQGTAMAVGAAASPQALAGFASVRTLTRIGVQLPLLINRALMPECSAAGAQGDMLTLRRLTALTMVTSILIILPICVVLLAAGPLLISVWTRGHIEASWSLIAVMTFVMLANALWQPLSNLILALNRQSEYSYIYLALCIAAVPLAYVLAADIGALGGALAMLAVDVLMLGWVWRLSERHFGSLGEILAAARSSVGEIRKKLSGIWRRG